MTLAGSQLCRFDQHVLHVSIALLGKRRAHDFIGGTRR